MNNSQRNTLQRTQLVQDAQLPDWIEECGRPCLRLQHAFTQILNERAPDTYTVDYVPVNKNPGHRTQVGAGEITEVEMRISLTGFPFLPDANRTVIECCVIQELKEHLGLGNFERLISIYGVATANSPLYCIRLNLDVSRKLEREIDGLSQKIVEESPVDRKTRLDTRLVQAFDNFNSPKQDQLQSPVNSATAAGLEVMKPYAKSIENLVKFCDLILEKGRYSIFVEPRYAKYDRQTQQASSEELSGIMLKIIINGEYEGKYLPSGDVGIIRFDIVQEIRDQLGWNTCLGLFQHYGAHYKTYFITLKLDRLSKLESRIENLQQKIAAEPPEDRKKRMLDRRDAAREAQARVDETLAIFALQEQLKDHPDQQFVKDLQVMLEIMTVFHHAYQNTTRNSADGFKGAILEAIPKFNWKEGIDGNAEQRYDTYITYVKSAPRYHDMLLKIFNGDRKSNDDKFYKYSDYCNDLIEKADESNNDEESTYFGTLRNMLQCAFGYVDTLPK